MTRQSQTMNEVNTTIAIYATPRSHHDPMDTSKYTVSVVLWGGNNSIDSTADPAGHMGLAIHDTVAQPATCHLHHACCPDQVHFISESRPSQPFAADPALRGRCDLRSDLSEDEARSADAVLARFGTGRPDPLPLYGEGNCHNWTATAVAALEYEGLVHPDDGEWWTEYVGLGPRGMQKSWVEDARRCWSRATSLRGRSPGQWMLVEVWIEAN
jgi:hypothetical protein